MHVLYSFSGHHDSAYVHTYLASAHTSCDMYVCTYVRMSLKSPVNTDCVRFNSKLYTIITMIKRIGSNSHRLTQYVHIYQFIFLVNHILRTKPCRSFPIKYTHMHARTHTRTYIHTQAHLLHNRAQSSIKGYSQCDALAHSVSRLHIGPADIIVQLSMQHGPC